MKDLSPQVRNFVERLYTRSDSAGYPLYLVGGAVRDELMGRPLRDLDFTTAAPVEVIKTVLIQAEPDSFYTLGEKFGTLAALVDGITVEITTFRAVPEPGTNAGGPPGLYADLARRDFTINAIARDRTGQLYDPYDGQTDIRHRLLRAVASAEGRFNEDPLRLLRAVRFAAELEFFIERETREWIRDLAHLLGGVPAERIGDEMDKLLLAPVPSRGIEELDNLGLMEFTVPEVLAMHEMERGAHHYKEVFPHTLKVLDRTEPDLILRWAALLHDIAKPATYGITDGEVHFFGHEKMGARMARSILTRLRRPEELVSQVEQLVAEHLRIGVYDATWSDGAVRRFLRETSPVTDRLFALSRADITSQSAQRVAAAIARVDALAERCETIKAQEDVAKLSSPLDGHDLMLIFGRRPGPWIGEVKDYLLGLVLDGVLAANDKVGAEARAVIYMSEHEGADRTDKGKNVTDQPAP